MAKTRVKPELPSGFKDYSPEQVLARQRMIRRIEEVYRCFGFVPLQTSIGQRRHVLTGGEAIENRLWDMRVDKAEITTDEARRVTARFDLTVPLARYVAEHMGDLHFPFRRFEWGNVFRGESPQAGRFCEFAQFDADIIGAPTGSADAEITVCMHAVMQALGIDRFVIKVNDRKVLNGFAERMGFASGSRSAAALMRTMDKADKIGIDGVLAELAAREAPEGEEEAFAFDDARLLLVRSFMELCDGARTNDERLARLTTYFENGVGAEGVAELNLIASLVRAAGVPESRWVVDPSVARGLGYYTGPVFETMLLDKPEFGSVYSGGRFDDLVSRFTGESLPSVGASVGVDRLFAALEKLGAVGEVEPGVDVFIISMEDRLVPTYFAIAAELRTAGIRVEIGMPHQDRSTKAQMAIAMNRRAPFILFLGSRDEEAGTIGVKATATRTQEDVPRTNLVDYLLAKIDRRT